MHFLFWCVAEHQEFRIPEFESLSRLFNIPLRWVFKSVTHPWVIMDLDSVAEARRFLSRSLSTKYCVLLWAQGDNYRTPTFTTASEAFHLRNLKLKPT